MPAERKACGAIALSLYFPQSTRRFNRLKDFSVLWQHLQPIVTELYERYLLNVDVWTYIIKRARRSRSTVSSASARTSQRTQPLSQF